MFKFPSHHNAPLRDPFVSPTLSLPSIYTLYIGHAIPRLLLIHNNSPAHFSITTTARIGSNLPATSLYYWLHARQRKALPSNTYIHPLSCPQSRALDSRDPVPIDSIILRCVDVLTYLPIQPYQDPHCEDIQDFTSCMVR